MRIRLDLKIFLFALIFLLTHQIKIYGIIMFFAFIHELGHILAGIILGFKPEKIDITPYGLVASFKVKAKDYNKKIHKGSMLCIKRMIIATAGPLTNLFIGLILAYQKSSSMLYFNTEREIIIYSNLLLMVFNLIPIYPLDGGRILKELLHIFCGLKKSYALTITISKIIIFILTLITSIVILYLKNISLVFIILYLWYLVLKEDRIYTKRKELYNKLEKKDLNIE